MVEKSQQIAHRLADDHGPRLVALERARTAAQNCPGLALRESEALADVFDVDRCEDAFLARLQRGESTVRDRSILRIQHTLAAVLAPPGRLVDGHSLAAVSDWPFADLPDRGATARRAGTGLDLLTHGLIYGIIMMPGQVLPSTIGQGSPGSVRCCVLDRRSPAYGSSPPLQAI